jgi:hypothetical protein
MVIVLVPTAATLPTRLWIFVADVPRGGVVWCRVDGVGVDRVVDEDFAPPDDPHAVPNNAEQTTSAATLRVVVRLACAKHLMEGSKVFLIRTNGWSRVGHPNFVRRSLGPVFPRIDLPLTGSADNARRSDG